MNHHNGILGTVNSIQFKALFHNYTYKIHQSLQSYKLLIVIFMLIEIRDLRFLVLKFIYMSSSIDNNRE